MLKCPQMTAIDADWPDGASGICENLRESADKLSWTSTLNTVNETTRISGTWVDPTYDSAGNMSGGPMAGAETTRVFYVYDAWNRLVQVKADNAGQPGAVVATYQYDGRGFRTKKTLADGTTYDYYQNDDNQLLEVRKNGSANAYEQYVYDQRYIDAPVMVYRDTNTDGTVDQKLYITQDANFNVTAVVDGATGVVVNRFVYTPYGQRTVLTATWTAGTTDFMLGHQGLYLDGESGLYYNRARYLHPTLGSFIQRDPLGYVDGANVYQYVKDSPTERVDPSGLQEIPLPYPLPNIPLPDVAKVPIGLPIKQVTTGIKILTAASPIIGAYAACTACSESGPKDGKCYGTYSATSTITVQASTGNVWLGPIPIPTWINLTYTPMCMRDQTGLYALVATWTKNGFGFGWYKCY